MDLLKNLKEGNFYYFSDEPGGKETVDMSGSGIPNIIRYISPPNNIVKKGGEPYLLPCKYVIKGTVSKDIETPTNYSSNVSMIDLKLLNSSLVKTEWLIDKKTFFSKQVVYKETTTPPVSEEKKDTILEHQN